MDAGAGHRAPRRDESGDAFVIWAKVPATARAARASDRPTPYNAIGRSTRGDAAVTNVGFDLSLLLP